MPELTQREQEIELARGIRRLMTEAREGDDTNDNLAKLIAAAGVGEVLAEMILREER